MFFEETLAMYNIGGGRMGRVYASRWRQNICAFSFFLFKNLLVPNAFFEKLEIVNYLNKQPSQIRLFKNKFAFVRNTQKLR